MELITRKDVVVGMLVDIKVDGCDEVVRGYIAEILSRSIGNKNVKVRIRNGLEGRVIDIPKKYEVDSERLKTFNRFFSAKSIYTIWDKKSNQPFIVDSKYGAVAFLFLEKEECNNFIKVKDLKDCPSNTIHPKKPIVESFKKKRVDSFVLSNKVRVTNDKLKEMQKEFNIKTSANFRR